MNMDREKKQKIIKIGGVVLGALLLLDLFLHLKDLRKQSDVPLPPVVIQKPLSVNMVEYVSQTGNTVAYQAVNLVARIEGFLENITFTDGTYVKKGQPLLVIEPEPYMAKLREAQATVAAEKAADAYSKAEYRRQQRMYKENATSLNNVEKWQAKTTETAADVAKALANLDIAQINYGYTHIASPFDGRIGRHLVDIGNLVGNGTATNLATVEQIDPIYVYFNLNELDLLKLRDAARAKGLNAKAMQQISVDVRLQNQTNYPFKGQLDFMNTGLNASTGTLEFRALLPNHDRALVPGLFVDVRIPVTSPTPQLTIPDTAVLYDQIGPYVLTVDSHHLVVLKRVTLGSVDQDRRAILKGLSPEDNVIINGIQNATPGNPVAPQEEKRAA